jgi:hypothetical protein
VGLLTVIVLAFFAALLGGVALVIGWQALGSAKRLPPSEPSNKE